MTLETIRNKRMLLEEELSQYIQDPANNQKNITVTRGRLLRALHAEYKLETDQNTKDSIKQKIDIETKKHREQLNNRISLNKNQNRSLVTQIPKELGLKFRKLSANVEKISESKSVSEGLVNTARSVGDVTSIATTVAKVPVVTVIKLGSAVAPTFGKLLVQPLQVPGYLFSKVINPNSTYNGQTITNMGAFLGKQVANILNATANGIKRL